MTDIELFRAACGDAPANRIYGRRRPVPPGTADRLKQALTARGLAVTQLARRVKCSHRTVDSILGGHGLPQERTMERIARELGVTALWLTEGPGEPRPGDRNGAVGEPRTGGGPST